jgi:hypothetical protein
MFTINSARWRGERMIRLVFIIAGILGSEPAAPDRRCWKLFNGTVFPIR